MQDESAGVWLVWDGADEYTPYASELDALRAVNAGQSTTTGDSYVAYYVPYGQTISSVRGW